MPSASIGCSPMACQDHRTEQPWTGLRPQRSAPVNPGPKPACSLAHALEAEAGDDPGPGRLTSWPNRKTKWGQAFSSWRHSRSKAVYGKFLLATATTTGVGAGSCAALADPG